MHVFILPSDAKKQLVQNGVVISQNSTLNKDEEIPLNTVNSQNWETDPSSPEYLITPGEGSTELSPFATMGINVNIFHERKARFRQLREDRSRVRGAAITLLAIVTSYLFCAFFSLFIRVLERVQGHNLLQDKNGVNTEFYTISTDLISFFVLFNSFLRVFIYYVANKEVRNDLR